MPYTEALYGSLLNSRSGKKTNKAGVYRVRKRVVGCGTEDVGSSQEKAYNTCLATMRGLRFILLWRITSGV